MPRERNGSLSKQHPPRCFGSIARVLLCPEPHPPPPMGPACGARPPTSHTLVLSTEVGLGGPNPKNDARFPWPKAVLKNAEFNRAAPLLQNDGVRGNDAWDGFFNVKSPGRLPFRAKRLKLEESAPFGF